MPLALESTDRLPKDARGPVQKYAGRLADRLGDDLRSLALFGSATGPEYVPGRSDVNLLVGVRALGVDALRAAHPPGIMRRGRRFIAPLVLTREYILSSLDTFPIEFIEMRERHVLLHGEDMLADLVIAPADIRRQCERELKTHLIRLRQAYLDTGRSKRELRVLLSVALTSLIPVFRSMLRLREPDAPRDRASVLAALGPVFAIQPAPFLAVEAARGKGGIDGRALESVFDQFQRELEALTRAADRM